MLSREENELLTRVCGDATMGQVLRRYWFPALLAGEVAEPDGTPVAVRLLGEDLVAFRDTQGRVGLIDERCPHRLASLAIGRNEDCGLTCIYHGWKFDVTGACVEMPTEPEGYGFKNRIRITAYPTHEAGGMIWTYMGPPEQQPPFPAYGWTALPREQRGIVKIGIRANYLQTVEGAIDSAHSWFLHRGSSRDWQKRFEISQDHSPKLEAEDTAYGFRYAAIRKPIENADTTKYVRVTLFALPSTAFIPPPLNPDLPAHTQIFVPVDDETTMLFDVFHSQNGTPVDEAQLRRSLHAEPGVDLDENGFRFARRENRWNQDRAAMRAGDWTGIAGFQNQDIAAQESMGRVVDRTREHLGTSDVAVIRMRRRMLETVRRFRGGEPLVGQDAPIPFERLASEQRLIPIGEPWQTVGAHAGEFAAT
ncbi:MAG TPA: Rieske 2Fe-2S domain-containing protein [Candidatus Elarobacter sp.]|jgi:phthalate 4,5-dioxygenase oxygenase subunit|nr:Rieske 2Fe-2S domain-containing protein [Candidatus Elarobacter sp.]